MREILYIYNHLFCFCVLPSVNKLQINKLSSIYTNNTHTLKIDECSIIQYHQASFGPYERSFDCIHIHIGI
jgi:hypothetical protein